MSLAEIGAANLVGIAVYLASALAAIGTALLSPKSDRAARTIWIAVAVAFLGLALFRYSGSEEILRNWLRGSLVSGAQYQSRGDLQVAALVACLAAGIYSFAWALPHAVNRPPWQIILAASASWLGLLYVLRIISLHAVDSVLYASLGKLHVNHVLELLPILATWYAAISCIKTQTKRAPGRGARSKDAR